MRLIAFALTALVVAPATAGGLDNHYFEANYSLLSANRTTATTRLTDAEGSRIGALARYQYSPAVDIAGGVGMIDLTDSGTESSELHGEVGYRVKFNDATDLRFSAGMKQIRIDDNTAANIDQSESGMYGGLEARMALSPALVAEGGINFSNGEALAGTEYYVGGTYQLTSGMQGILRYNNHSSNAGSGLDTDGVSFGIRMGLK
ncbi:MAG: hypothetical protein HWE20_00125 [Gammaproteobacteria bacterium]|nr:hypothetical protein [Gammaproteobacteria bacterium]